MPLGRVLVLLVLSSLLPPRLSLSPVLAIQSTLRCCQQRQRPCALRRHLRPRPRHPPRRYVLPAAFREAAVAGYTALVRGPLLAPVAAAAAPPRWLRNARKSSQSQSARSR